MASRASGSYIPGRPALFATNVISVMGLGVGIDYCPFIIYRYREERAQVLNQVEAIAATGDTARRAVSLAALPSSPPCRPC